MRLLGVSAPDKVIFFYASRTLIKGWLEALKTTYLVAGSITELVRMVSRRVVGLLERDEEYSYLNLEECEDDPVQQVVGCSVS